MIYEEAIKVLRNKRKLGVTLEEAHAYMLAIEAMELRVAKPVINTTSHLDQITGHCPSCGSKDSEQRGFETYCRECGQKLIWK